MFKLLRFIALLQCLFAVSQAGSRPDYSGGSSSTSASSSASSSSTTSASSSATASASTSATASASSSATASASSSASSAECGYDPQCPLNEHYEDCIYNCPSRTCESLDKAYVYPVDPAYPCTSGCECDDGYYRNDEGKCVTEDECRKCTTQCPPNEHYEECSYKCPPRTCESLDRAYICPVDPDYPCNPGCVCDDGYYRDDFGNCVTEAECRKCPGRNQVWDPCPGCSPQTCETRNNTYHCPLSAKCEPACRCIKGYFLNYKGICVPADDCETCPENEVFSKCPDPCSPQTCAEAGYPLNNCGPRNDTCSTKPRCICKSGYLRDSNDVCVPTDQCPSCGGDKNAKPGCGNHCGNSCSDYAIRALILCAAYCEVNGCDCRKDYVYDHNIKKCVKYKDCTPTCKENEEFSDCANNPCRPQECKDKGKVWKCPAIAKNKCRPGCLCKKKYLRRNGTCVPEEDCFCEPC